MLGWKPLIAKIIQLISNGVEQVATNTGLFFLLLLDLKTNKRNGKQKCDDQYRNRSYSGRARKHFLGKGIPFSYRGRGFQRPIHQKILYLKDCQG